MRYQLLAGMILGLAATSASWAATLDFNTATTQEYATAPYVEDGFQFTVLTGHYDIWPPQYCGPGTLVDPCPTTNYFAVDSNFGNSRVRLTTTDGTYFDLLSLFVFQAVVSNCSVTCLTSSNGGSTLFALEGAMTFSGPQWTNVAWVEFSAILGGLVSVDDIVVAPIPVPAAVWLFGSALGVMGWLRRKATAELPGRT